MATIAQTIPAAPLELWNGLAGNQADLEALVYDVLRAGFAGLDATGATIRLIGRRAARRVRGCAPRHFTADELSDRDAVIAHVAQRVTFARTQLKAEKLWWRNSRKEAKQIGRLMANKLGQLGFDYIFSIDGDKQRKLVKFDSVEISPDQYRYRVNSRKLPRGVCEVDMTDDKIIKGMECTIQKTIQYHISEMGLWFMVDRQCGLRNIPRFVDYVDVMNEVNSKMGPLVIPLGLGQNRTPTLVNLGHETTAHFLIGGTTGAGKTNAVHAIICTLIKRRPDEIKIILIDLKGIEFPQYNDVPHLAQPVITDPAKVLPLVESLWSEVQERMTLLRKMKGVNHIKEYNQRLKPADRLPYKILIFDELAIVMLDRTLKHKEEIESYLARIASVGRASGIHLVLATQRPDKNVLTPLITANFPGRIALATASVYDSMTIIGNGDACFQEAVPPGRAILGYSRFRMPFQIAYVKNDLRRSIIDDAEGGRFGIKRMTHDVTIQELARYAIQNFDSNFSRNNLFSQFQDRGITRFEIQELIRIYTVEKFIMEDGEHILERTGRNKPIMVSGVLQNEDVQDRTYECQVPDAEEMQPMVHIPSEKPDDDDDQEYNEFSRRVMSEIEGVPSAT
jgi:hypothetical protein